MTLAQAKAISMLNTHPDIAYLRVVQEEMFRDMTRHVTTMDYKTPGGEKDYVLGQLRGMMQMSYEAIREEAKAVIEADMKKRENEAKAI